MQVAMIQDEERFVGRPGVALMFDCSGASVDRLEEQKVIPRRRQLGRGRVGWLYSELVEAMRALPQGPLTTRTAAARSPEAQARAIETRKTRRAGTAA